MLYKICVKYQDKNYDQGAWNFEKFDSTIERWK